MLLGQETLATLLESGLYKCYHRTILLTKLNNQNLIFPPVKLKQPLGEGGVIFLAVLDRLDPQSLPYPGEFPLYLKHFQKDLSSQLYTGRLACIL